MMILVPPVAVHQILPPFGKTNFCCCIFMLQQWRHNRKKRCKYLPGVNPNKLCFSDFRYLTLLFVTYVTNALAIKWSNSTSKKKKKILDSEEKSLIGFAPGVNFTNIIWAAFTPVDPKSTIRHWCLDWIFSLLGFARVKAACKHVGEIDPWSQFLTK